MAPPLLQRCSHQRKRTAGRGAAAAACWWRRGLGSGSCLYVSCEAPCPSTPLQSSRCWRPFPLPCRLCVFPSPFLHVLVGGALLGARGGGAGGHLHKLSAAMAASAVVGLAQPGLLLLQAPGPGPANARCYCWYR